MEYQFDWSRLGLLQHAGTAVRMHRTASPQMKFTTANSSTAKQIRLQPNSRFMPAGWPPHRPQDAAEAAARQIGVDPAAFARCERVSASRQGAFQIALNGLCKAVSMACITPNNGIAK